MLTVMNDIVDKIVKIKCIYWDMIRCIPSVSETKLRCASLESWRLFAICVLTFEMLSLMIIASAFFVASGSTINNETKDK